MNIDRIIFYIGSLDWAKFTQQKKVFTSASDWSTTRVIVEKVRRFVLEEKTHFSKAILTKLACIHLYLLMFIERSKH